MCADPSLQYSQSRCARGLLEEGAFRSLHGPRKGGNRDCTCRRTAAAAAAEAAAERRGLAWRFPYPLVPLILQARYKGTRHAHTCSCVPLPYCVMAIVAGSPSSSSPVQARKKGGTPLLPPPSSLRPPPSALRRAIISFRFISFHSPSIQSITFSQNNSDLYASYKYGHVLHTSSVS